MSKDRKCETLLPNKEDAQDNLVCGVNVGDKALPMLGTQTCTRLGPSVLFVSLAA